MRITKFLFLITTTRYSYNYNFIPKNNINNNIIINQIRGDYSFFNYNPNKDIYRYGSKKRRIYKKNIFKKGLVEDHHIVPKQFKNNCFINEINYDVSCSNNILIMPSFVSSYILNDTKRIYHHSHKKYNKYIESNIESILNNNKSKDEKQYNFWLFVKNTESKLINNDKLIPWD
tara:strand:+ start:460 stop:981 length:522 start_codon:yes stop_codon:yes gene_type:complete